MACCTKTPIWGCNSRSPYVGISMLITDCVGGGEGGGGGGGGGGLVRA